MSETLYEQVHRLFTTLDVVRCHYCWHDPESINRHTNDRLSRDVCLLTTRCDLSFLASIGFLVCGKVPSDKDNAKLKMVYRFNRDHHVAMMCARHVSEVDATIARDSLETVNYESDVAPNETRSAVGFVS